MKSTTKKEKKYSTVYPIAKDLWLKYYRYKSQQEYYFTGKCAGNLSKLLDKIVFQMTEKSAPITDESIINNLRGFLASITDEWVIQNLELSIVNSKFNVLFKNAINKSPEARSSQLDDLIARKFANGNQSAGG